MKKKIIFFILAVILLGIVIGCRLIFVCNGDVIENVLYKSENIIIQQVQKGNRNLVVLGLGYSMSINEQNEIVKHDPFMTLTDVEFQEESVISIFYPFESKGLEDSGKELSAYINSILQDFDSITLIGHSKCGVCFANAVKWIKCKNLNIVTVSTPFQGTPMVDKKSMFEKLNWSEKLIYTLIFSNHTVDQDLIPNSNFLMNVADYSGLENCMHINIVSKCPQRSSNLLDLLLKYLDNRGRINGDGIAPIESQQSISYTNTIERVIESTHPNSLKIGLEIMKTCLELEAYEENHETTPSYAEKLMKRR